jgi:hypothetical protein
MKKMMINKLKLLYDGDNDTMPGLPRVTWAEFQLLEIIERMEERIEELEIKVSDLRDNNPHTMRFV